MDKIAIIVPTNRPQNIKNFYESWKDSIKKYGCEFILVKDGPNPQVIINPLSVNPKIYTCREIMGEYEDVIFNFSDSVRNLGFAYVAKYMPNVTHLISIDDDCFVLNDSIGDHLNILGKEVPTQWMSTTLGHQSYMRGFPYNIRNEAKVVVSHGVWVGSYDWDAITEIQQKEKLEVEFYRGIIPNKVFFPFSGMNIGFLRSELPSMYYAPMGERAFNIHRFGDIFLGISLVQEYDNAKAIASGYSKVIHKKASNIQENLKKEKKGMEINEDIWKDSSLSTKYTELYKKVKLRWKEFMVNLV